LTRTNIVGKRSPSIKKRKGTVEVSIEDAVNNKLNPVWWALDGDTQKKLIESGEAHPKEREAKPEVKAAVRAQPLSPDFIQTFEAPVYKKDAEQKSLLKETAKQNFLLKDLVTGAKTDLKKLINAFETVEVKQGKNVVKKGEKGNHFYVVEHGRVEFRIDDKVVGTCEQGHTFGEQNLLYQGPEKADVFAASSDGSMEPTKLLRLHQEVYRGIKQTSEETKKPTLPPPRISEKETSWLEDNKIVQEQQAIKKALKNSTLDDLEKIKVLGEGQFGEVWLVETKLSGVPAPATENGKHQFALKIQCKFDEQRENEAEDDIRAEIEVMGKLSHPFISALFNWYESEDSIDMLLGLMPGGELWDVVHKENPETGEWVSGLPESHARFYAMVIADTLGYMHAQKYVFRDLKPENILIDKDGYPIIIDFGFCKKVQDKTYTFCGTPNYVAPEIVSNAGHNAAVDWWAFGIVIYEMVSGENPFYYDGLDDIELFDAIMSEEGEPLKDCFSRPVRKLVNKLLIKDPTKRLGMLKGRAKDVLEHEWFEGLSLKRLRAKKIKAPWIPGQEKKEGDEEDYEVEMERQKKLAEEEKLNDIRRQKEEEAMRELRELEEQEQKRREEAARRKEIENEERKRRQELQRQQQEQEERARQRQLELKRQQEQEERQRQEALRLEEERQYKLELKRQQEEEERQRQQEEQEERERQHQLELRRQQEEEERQRQEALRLEEERQYQLKLKQQREEEERQRQEALRLEEERQHQLRLKREAEEERQRQEALRLEEERQHQLRLKREAEEERRRQEELRLQEERQRQLELKKQQDEERRRQEELRLQEERKRQLELKKQQEEERRRQLELKRQQEEERRRQLELKRQQEEERRRKKEHERQLELKRQEEEKLKREEEEKQRQLEIEMERQRQLEIERQEEEERERLHQEELKREMEANLERLEIERQKKEERERRRDERRKQEEEENRLAEERLKEEELHNQLLRQKRREQELEKEREEMDLQYKLDVQRKREERERRRQREMGGGQKKTFRNHLGNSSLSEMGVRDLDGPTSPQSIRHRGHQSWNPTSPSAARRTVRDITSPGKGYVSKVVNDGFSPGDSPRRRKELEELSKVTPSGLVAKRLSAAKKKELSGNVPSLFQF